MCPVPHLHPSSLSLPYLFEESQVTGKSALELFKAEVEQPPITTFSLEIDKMLGGGVPLGAYFYSNSL